MGIVKNKIKPDGKTEKRIKEMGMTLIEIMVALSLGTILILGTIQIFTSARAAFRLSSSISKLNDNARFVLSRMQQVISQAGYMDPSSVSAQLYPQLERDYLVTGNTDGINDGITIKFNTRKPYGSPGRPFIDCSGTEFSTSTNSLITNFFSLNGDKLLCRSNGTTILAEGVKFLKIHVGEDLDGDAVPNRYKPPFVLAQFPSNDASGQFYSGAFNVVSFLSGAATPFDYPFNKAQASSACQTWGGRLATRTEFDALQRVFGRFRGCYWVETSATPINNGGFTIPPNLSSNRNNCSAYAVAVCYGLYPLQANPPVGPLHYN